MRLNRVSTLNVSLLKMDALKEDFISYGIKILVLSQAKVSYLLSLTVKR